ncbi:MAG: ABC transporter ATP-binding protein [Bacteroidota bacterium]
MENSPLLEVKNLNIRFPSEGGDFHAVKDFSFMLNKGETLGIVGESGSGKSVTCLSLLRLLPGECRIDGSSKFYFEEKEVDLVTAKENELRKIRGKHISMIFQEPMTSLNPTLKCGYQASEILIEHEKISSKDAKKKIISLLEEVALLNPERIFNSYPHELSGGQRQRVMIAMALSCKPELLIADEPTTALDVTVQKNILATMKRLKETHNLSMIFITHDLGVVSEVADNVAVLYKGELVEFGTTQQILNNPVHPYTKGLIACRPNMKHRLVKLPTVSDFLQNSEAHNLFMQTEESADVRKARHTKMYSCESVLQVTSLKTYFPVKKGFFSKRPEPVRAVDDVSFDVYPGETLGLVGESGCGKSTLGRTLLRLVDSTSGNILYKGKELTQMKYSEMKHLRRHLQIIFQDPYSSLNPKLTVGYAITEPMKVQRMEQNDKERRKVAAALMECVGLSEEDLKKYPHEFSGGQRQRVCIARALALKPEFIICDESVSALDVSVQAQVLNLLNELKNDFGFTYIFISHDLSVVKFMSDRIIVMKSGKIEEEGEADSMYKNPKSDYTKKLIAAIPGMK